MHGSESAYPLLIVEAEPEGRSAGLVQGIHAAFPGIRVISLPYDFKPSELFFFIGTALPMWSGFRSESVECATFSNVS